MYVYYGGPEGRAMRQYLSDNVYATIDNIYAMVDDNYTMIDDNYATMMMWRSLVVADKRPLSQFASYSVYIVVGKYHSYYKLTAIPAN